MKRATLPRDARPEETQMPAVACSSRKTHIGHLNFVQNRMKMWRGSREDSKEWGIRYVDAKIAMLSAALKVVALQSHTRKNMELS